MNKMKILLIFLLVVFLAIVTYIAIFVYQQGGMTPNKNYTNFANAVSAKLKIPTLGTDPTEAALNGVLVTLRGGQFGYMKADITFKMKNESDEKKIEKNMQAVRNLVLQYTSTLDSTRLMYPNQREQYKSDLKKIIYKTFGYEVEDIYFRNFVLAQ
ncbi:MAG: flagellar basal body-associated FliL family protein [Sulfurospirillaceae bacterium]|nr:flagellar basal body-associated FliL family protein [Sulfurospirillaceae bacterium]